MIIMIMLIIVTVLIRLEKRTIQNTLSHRQWPALLTTVHSA